MKRLTLPFLLLILLVFTGCKKENLVHFDADDIRLIWKGRTWHDTNGIGYLAGSASSLEFIYYGDQCRIWLQNAAPGADYNYISLVVDGVRQARSALRSDTLTPLEIIAGKPAPFHHVQLYKETEPANGLIVISGVEADSIGTIPAIKRKRIEFIGNSITVGMSADESLVPCDGGTWYDQNNAYDAFGPVVARTLDMDYLVAGFSGIGVYRNTRSDSPVMDDIYGSALLSPDPQSPRWDFKRYVPDIISICLGTNDFSDGGGVTPRSPFDSTRFIPAYVAFLKKLHSTSPEAQIIITNTPMLSASDNTLLLACLDKIKASAEATIPGLKPVLIFSFSKMYNSGCYGHPSVVEHQMMAAEMEGVLRKVSSEL